METTRSTLAPLESLSNVVPSLDSSPNRTPRQPDVTIAVEDTKNEVTFKSGSSSSSSSISEVEEESTKPKIPDGGWGWVVVFSSLVISMIADGISFSFGLLYEEFKDEFKASSSETSWIGSLFLSIPLLTGPVMSALVDKYGCRPMTIIGGLISAFGFIISCKVYHIGIMCLTFGVISGLGLGLCYVTVVVSIAFWFDKKRTLAVGIGAAGTGVGTFVFPPLTSYLLSEFHWRGTTLLLAGAFLNICVCGALMIDPDWITKQNKDSAKLSKSGKSSKTSLVSDSSTNFQNSIDINELKKILKSGKDAEYFLQTLEASLQTQASPDKTLKNVHNSLLNLPTYVKENEKVPIEVLEQLSSNKKLYNIILENYPSLILCRSTSDQNVHRLEGNNEQLEKVPVTLCMTLRKEDKPKALIHQNSLPEDHAATLEPLMNEENTKNPNRPPRRNASLPWMKQHLVQSQKQHYFKNIKFHWKSSMAHRGAMININKYRLRASSCPNMYKVSMITLPEKDQKWNTELLELMKGILDFSLFLELHFFLMSLSTIILFIWFIVPYFYLAELMETWGYNKNTEVPMTIANIGITNTIGMIVLGWAGDQTWMSITKSYAVCLVLCGLSCAGIMYYIENFIMLEICAGLFGLFFSSAFAFTPGILVELIPLERFTIAYGLQLLCMGIGNLLGPPYAGLLNDVTGTWNQSFYQAAIWIIISGLLVAIIPCTKNRKIIGTGFVEKEVEGSVDNFKYLFAIVPVFLGLTVLFIYCTIVSFT